MVNGGEPGGHAASTCASIAVPRGGQCMRTSRPRAVVSVATAKVQRVAAISGCFCEPRLDFTEHHYPGFGPQPAHPAEATGQSGSSQWFLTPSLPARSPSLTATSSLPHLQLSRSPFAFGRGSDGKQRRVSPRSSVLGCARYTASDQAKRRVFQGRP